MKHIVLTIAVLLTASVLAFGQDNTKRESYTRDGKTFVQEKKSTGSSGDRVTDYLWKDSKGNEYPIILHTYVKGEKKGRTTAYVIRTSAKTGKEYKYYLPDGERIAEEILKEQ